MKGNARDLGDPGTPAFRLDKYPFYLLNRLVSRYNGVIGSRLRAIGLSIPYWRVLMVLGEHSPRSVGQLADNAVIPFSTMTRIVQRMAADGLISAESLESDNRVTEVAMTDAGKDRLAQARAITAPIYAEVIEGFSLAEFEALIGSLDRLYVNLEDLASCRR